MINTKKLFILLLLFTFCSLPFADLVHADTTQTAINNGINYLGTQLNGATGQITGGSTGDASPWAAIAFSANGIDPQTIKTSTGAPSLLDYLKNNPPTTASSTTDWEKWILAIVASGQNPYNFGGINSVTTLESSTYYHDSQLGDTGSATDDWFGVLALIAGGVDKTDVTLTDSLSFILSHQNADGGFGYAITAGSDGNDTAAAIQALVAAKNYGVTNPTLDTAIVNAKTYLLSTQDTSGGFLYDTNPWTTAPDSDSTTWALIGLNALSLQNTESWNKAATWLISQQSQTDGGFTACNSWDPNTFACTGYASNSTTTSHALIGLSGKEWLIKIFDASSTQPTPIDTVSPTPTLVPSPTLTVDQPTPTPTIVYVTNTTTNTVTNTVYATPTPQIVYTTIEKYITTQSTPTPEVLGTSVKFPQNQTFVKSASTDVSLPSIFLGMGIAFLGFYVVQIGGKFLTKN